MAAATDLDAHRKRFTAYADAFRTGRADHDANVELKRDHCLRVLAEAEAITAAPDTPGMGSWLAACLLAALYHDVGRFEQYQRFGTFRDSLSRDHGALGALVLGREQFLDGLDPAEQALVRAVTAVHNRRRLPPGLPPAAARAAAVVRDADKLDIYPVILAHLAPGAAHNPVVVLELTPHETAYTPAILEDVAAGRLADYRRMAWTNDFKLLLLSWVHDLNFPATSRILARRGHVRALLDMLPALDVFVALGRGLERRLAEQGAGQGTGNRPGPAGL